ncbi:MAG: hypothetical protein ACKVK0_13875, partial [Pirellulales bacterium]
MQTYSPEHLAIVAATQHDYALFAEQELPGREEFGYPPYCSMIRLIIRGADDAASMQYAQHLAQCCQAAIDQ